MTWIALLPLRALIVLVVCFLAICGECELLCTIDSTAGICRW